MKALRDGALFVAVALMAGALAGVAQNPGPSKTLPGAGPAPEARSVSVEVVNQVPPVDRQNLQTYWTGVASRTKEHWLLPALARPPQSTPGEVKIECWVHTDGSVTGMHLEQPSGKPALDRAALAAIRNSLPYDAYPYGISVDQVRVRFTFVYNGGASGAPLPGSAEKPVK